MNKLDAIQGTATAALATTVVAPTSSEWKQLGLAALSAVVVAVINVVVSWLRARVPVEEDPILKGSHEGP